jgi:hypothetical protein
MRKPNAILDFFKRQNAQSSNVNVGDVSSPTSDFLVAKNSHNNSRRFNINEFDINSLEYDLGLCHQL